MKNITKIITRSLTGIGAALTLTAGKAMALTVQEGIEHAYVEGLPKDLTIVVKNASVTVLGVVAILAIIMLIYGGIRYITSGGDSKKVTDAKNTVLYAIIGLVISFLSYAIINFIITNVISTPNA